MALNTLTLDPTFWILVSFLLLLGFAFRPFKEKIGLLLKERRDTICHQLAEAEEILKQAYSIEQAAEHYLEEVEFQVQEILVLAEQEASYLKEKLQKEKERIKTSHQLLLHEYEQLMISKLEQALRQALLTQAFIEAERQFASSHPPLMLAAVTSSLEKTVGHFQYQENLA